MTVSEKRYPLSRAHVLYYAALTEPPTTCAELARRVGVSRQVLSGWLRRGFGCPEGALRRIADALGVRGEALVAPVSCVPAALPPGRSVDAAPPARVAA